jgi:transposase
MWEDVMLKVLARLKKVPATAWIKDLPSHASQNVVKRIILAIKAMLREQRKGDAGQDTGFPRQKKRAISESSIYLANTMVKIDWSKEQRFKRQGDRIYSVEGHTIHVGGGVGPLACGSIGNIPSFSKLGEMRIFKEAGRWWAAGTFRFNAPSEREKTGKVAAIKVAARDVFTVFEKDPHNPSDEGHVLSIPSRVWTTREDALFRISSVRASRAQKRSKSQQKAYVTLARMHEHRRNARNDVAHKGSALIARDFDEVVVDTMDVKRMLRKKHLKQRSVKAVRVKVINAGMAAAVQKVAYKVESAGGTFEKMSVREPTTQICSACGYRNEQMKTGRAVLKCRNCGTSIPRQENAARHMFSVKWLGAKSQAKPKKVRVKKTRKIVTET